MNGDFLLSFGLLGTSLIILSVLVTAFFYHGWQGERFSLLNHFVSELGETGVSRLAKLFNFSFIIGVLVLVPFMIGLGWRLGTVLGWIAAGLGTIASLACSAVGVIPMNNLVPHRKAAMTFFRTGLLMILFFGLAILFQPQGRLVISPSANLLSVIAFCSYAAFLTLTAIKKPIRQGNGNLDPHEVWEKRPRVSLLTIFEWAIFFSTILWIFGIGLYVIPGA
jgi:hypothetical protein